MNVTSSRSMRRQPIAYERSAANDPRKDSALKWWDLRRCLGAILLLCLVTATPLVAGADSPRGQETHSSAPAGPEDQGEARETAGKPRLVVQLGHSQPIARLLFSPDGKLLLTGDGEHDVLWDAGTGREIRRWRNPVTVVDFSPDGKHVTTLENGRTRRERDIETGNVTRQVTSPLEADKALAFRVRTGDGKVLVVDRETDGTIRLLDEETGKLCRELRGHSKPVFAVAARSDGKQLLTGSADATARLWDVATGAEFRCFAGAGDEVAHVAFGPDGETVLTSGKPRATFDADGRLLPGRWQTENEETTRVWSVADGKQLHSFAGRLHGWLPGGKLVITGTQDGAFFLWNLATGAEFRRFQGNSPDALEISPDGKHLLTSGADGTSARLWDVESGAIVQRFEGGAVGINAVAFSANGQRIVTGGKDGAATLWDAAGGHECRRLVGHTTPVNCVAISPDGKRVATGSGEMLLSPESSLRLWDAATGHELRRLVDGRARITSAAFSPDGKTVVSTSAADDYVRLWNVETGAAESRFGPLPGFQDFTSVAFSPDGKWVLAGVWFGRTEERVEFPTSLHLWDVATGKRSETPYWAPVGANSVAVSPDGSRLVAGFDDGCAKVMNIRTGEEVPGLSFDHLDPRHRIRLAQDREYEMEWRDRRTPIVAVAFSPDGKSVLTSGWDRTVRLWDVATGNELRRFVGHASLVKSLAFSPDGKWVLTGSEDATARLWDAATGKELCWLISFRDGAEAVIAADGRFDVSRFDAKLGVHCFKPDQPLRPLPLDVLRRDYHEPHLLARLLAGKAAPPLRNVDPGGRSKPGSP